jgi:putative transcriptional regulator
VGGRLSGSQKGVCQNGLTTYLMEEIVLRPGVLLIAPPAMTDPNFHRAVVFLCEHTEEGSFGLVLNKPLDAQPADLVQGMEAYDGRLSLGGPVQTDTIHYLHRHGGSVTDAQPIIDGVLWGGDFDMILAIINAYQTSANDLRFFLGYAGWGEGQLYEEVEAGGWIVTGAQPHDIFDVEPDVLWRDVLRRMGGEYAILANFPDDPRMN